MRETDFKRINDRPTELTRIVLIEKDGTEQIIDLDDDLHYIFTFTRAKAKGGTCIPMEILIKGSVDICGEMFHQLGEAHPSLIEHCAKRAFQKSLEMLKAKGVDPLSEILKNLPGVGGNQ